MNQDTEMICFARRVAEVSSSILLHVVEYRLAVDTGESEGKNIGCGLVNPNSDVSRYVSCCANRDLGESLLRTPIGGRV